MNFNKTKVKREIEEILSDMNNILYASSDVYQDRVIQFINRINNSELLSKLFQPYFDMEVDQKYGFHIYNGGYRIDYKLAPNDDEEIAIILQFLKDNSIGERIRGNHLNNIAHCMYHYNKYDDCVYEFNNKIISPTFDKLNKKIFHKLEDLNLINATEIDQNMITLVAIGDVNNSNIAIGNKIDQNNINVDDVINEINNYNSVDEKLVKELLDILEEIKNNNMDRRSAFEKLADLIGKFINYYSALKPLLVNVMELISNLIK